MVLTPSQVTTMMVYDKKITFRYNSFCTGEVFLLCMYIKDRNAKLQNQEAERSVH